ncbi:alpha/beta fold hydrolase [Citricoccus sp. GCM10030269]|uniref:alpha/beta fold hydrolase n=1 Tax=Citricoccus sp. GCM10030269 TaxID=3273388 RepID=UPI0036238F4D
MNDALHTVRLTDHAVTLLDLPPEPSSGQSSPDRTLPPLVLLHGGGGDHRMWSRQYHSFPERRVVIPDARGHGGSTGATESHRLVDDLVELLDGLGIERAVVAGISMGGGTAVDLALEFPERCAGLLISGTGTSEPTFTDPWSHARFAAMAAAAEANDPDAWVEAFMQFYYGPSRNRGDLSPEVVELLESMVRDTVAAMPRDPQGNLVPPQGPTPVLNTWERASGITVPVLALNGELDSPDHLENGRRLAETVPDGQYSEIPGAAHCPNLENPVDYGRQVREFLREQGI